MIVYRNDGKKVNVTQKAYDVIYKRLGYSINNQEKDYTKAELQELLKNKGIDFKKSATKDDLKALFNKEV